MLKKRGKKELSTLIRVIRKSKNSKRERDSSQFCVGKNVDRIGKTISNLSK